MVLFYPPIELSSKKLPLVD